MKPPAWSVPSSGASCLRGRISRTSQRLLLRARGVLGWEPGWRWTGSSGSPNKTRVTRRGPPTPLPFLPPGLPLFACVAALLMVGRGTQLPGYPAAFLGWGSPPSVSPPKKRLPETPTPAPVPFGKTLWLNSPGPSFVPHSNSVGKVLLLCNGEDPVCRGPTSPLAPWQGSGWGWLALGGWTGFPALCEPPCHAFLAKERNCSLTLGTPDQKAHKVVCWGI